MEDCHKNYCTWLQGLILGVNKPTCCLVQGVSISTFLSYMVIGTNVLGFGVSITAELLLSEGILLVTGVITAVCGTVVVFTGVSGSGVLGIVGCSSVLCIPWLFLEGVPDPVIKFILVTSLMISLHNAMFITGACCKMQWWYYEKQSKTGEYLKVILLLSVCQPMGSELLLFELM